MAGPPYTRRQRFWRATRWPWAMLVMVPVIGWKQAQGAFRFWVWYGEEDWHA